MNEKDKEFEQRIKDLSGKSSNEPLVTTFTTPNPKNSAELNEMMTDKIRLEKLEAEFLKEQDKAIRDGIKYLKEGTSLENGYDINASQKEKIDKIQEVQAKIKQNEEQARKDKLEKTRAEVESKKAELAAKNADNKAKEASGHKAQSSENIVIKDTSKVSAVAKNLNFLNSLVSQAKQNAQDYKALKEKRDELKQANSQALSESGKQPNIFVKIIAEVLKSVLPEFFAKHIDKLLGTSDKPAEHQSENRPWNGNNKNVHGTASVKLPDGTPPKERNSKEITRS